jgi:hypothetical protein
VWWHKDATDSQSPGEPTGVKATSAAKGNKRRLSRVGTLFHRDRTQGPLHMSVDYLEHARDDTCDIETCLYGEAFRGSTPGMEIKRDGSRQGQV